MTVLHTIASRSTSLHQSARARAHTRNVNHHSKPKTAQTHDSPSEMWEAASTFAPAMIAFEGSLPCGEG